MGRPEVFLDRAQEVQELTDFFLGPIQKSKACVVTATSGVGKTRLTQEVARQIPASAYIRVSPVRHRGIGGESFYYAELLVDATDQALSKIDSANSFKTYREKYGKKPFLSAITSDARDLARKLHIPVETLSHLGSHARKILPFELPASETQERTEFDLKIDYLRHTLENQRYLYVLENFQDIDLRSYETLLSLFDARAPHFWLFEFTTGGLDGSSTALELDDLMDDLRLRCDYVMRLKLERLPAKHVVDLVAVNDNLIRFVLDRYRDSDGNLRPFMDLAYGGSAVHTTMEERFRRSPHIPLYAITEANITELSEGERLVLYCVYILGRLSTVRLLQELAIFAPISLFSVDDSIETLAQRKLTVSSGTRVDIYHDRIGTAIEQLGKNDRLFNLARTVIRARLEKIVEADRSANRSTDPEILSTLCTLYNELGESARASLLLADVARLIAQSGRTDYLVDVLRTVEKNLEQRRKLPEEFRKAVFKQLCGIYYAAGFPSDALRACLQLPQSIHRSLIQAILLDLTYEHEEALNLVDNFVLPYIEETNQLYIPAKLTDVSIRRSLNQHENCRQELRKLLDNIHLKANRDYPLVKRATEMAFSFDQVEELLLSAAEELLTQARQSEAARTYIIGIYVKAVLGKFDDAQACAAMAEKLMSESFNERQCLLNNVAASRMLMGRFDEETLDLIRRARLTAVGGYDHVVVLNNHMIFNAMSPDASAAKGAASYLEKALLKTAVREKDILRILYFNLAQFWKGIDETRRADALKRSKDNQCDYGRRDWENIWRLPDWSNDQFRGVGQLPFIPTFLSYWTADLGALLQHVQ